MGLMLQSKHQQENTFPFGSSEAKSMTIAVYEGPTLKASHTLRYSPTFIKKSDQGIFTTTPTPGGNLFVQKFGYYATTIMIKGTTGRKVETIAGKKIDGESALKSLREILLGAFGERRRDGKYVIIAGDGGETTELDPEKTRVFLFDWLGEASLSPGNEEFYEVVPNNNQIFDYERAAGKMYWTFNISLIGHRVKPGSDVFNALDDPINRAFIWEQQFTSVYDYFSSITIGGKKAFTWVDFLNHYIAESYYKTLAHTQAVKDAVELAYIQASSYINIPFLIQDDLTSTVSDIMDDLGAVPNDWTGSPAKGVINWDAIAESRSSFRALSRLSTYPEKFINRSQEGGDKNSIVHRVSENDDLRTVCNIYGADWIETVTRNSLKYPYSLTPGQKIIIPVTDQRKTDNTIRATLSRTGIEDSDIEARIYGTDILVDENGEWQYDPNENDLAIASGRTTVIQDLEAMEKTRQGELFDYPEYGNPLNNFIGKRVLKNDIDVLLIQLKNSILTDQRFSRVDKMEATYEGGSLNLSQILYLSDGANLKITIPIG